MRPSVAAKDLQALGLTPSEAASWAQRAETQRGADGEAAWRALRDELVAVKAPFALHAFLYGWCSGPTTPRPLPGWWPTAEGVQRSNLHALMTKVGAKDYESLHRWSIQNRAAFWDSVVQALRIRFAKAPSTSLEGADPESPTWFPRGRLNIVDSCFQAPPDKTAIVYATEGSTSPVRISYRDLEQLTNRVANGLDALGVGRSDPIALYMPMTPEAVALYLGAIRSGRSVVGISDASAAQDVENKCRIVGAKLLVTSDEFLRGGKILPLYSRLKGASVPRTVVVPRGSATPTLRDGDVPWSTLLSTKDTYASVACEPDATTNILFSSGTTKDPKAIPWSHTTPIKAAMDAHYHHDVHAEDVLAWPTSFGWMMGPWLTYAALIHGATFALWNGDPRSRAFGEFVRDAGVTMLGVVPKLVQDWRVNRRMEGLDWSRIRRFSSTAEASDPDDMLYLMHLAGYAPILEYCGGTEIGGGYLTGTLVQPQAPATFSTPALGVDVVLLGDAGGSAARGEVGLVPPSIGLSLRLLNYDHHEEYFAVFPRGPRGEVLRRHGDQLERLPGGFWRHLGRTKDTINLGGVKTSSEEIRHAITHPLVADAKPVAVDGDVRGQQVLVVYAVPYDRAKTDPERLRLDFQQAIKTRLNPLLAHVHDVVLVDELPQAGPGKTRTSDWFRADYAQRKRPPQA